MDQAIREKIGKLQQAIWKLESADSLQQEAHGPTVLCEESHNLIEVVIDNLQNEIDKLHESAK